MFDVKPIVQQLKSYIKKHGIKQTELAKRLAVSNPTLSRWLNERTNFNPTLKQIISIADMFGVTLTELFSQGNSSVSALPEKGTKRTGKTTMSKTATKTPSKAASTMSQKVKSGDGAKGKTTKKKVRASAVATVSKEAKTKKSSNKKGTEKKVRKSTAGKTAKVSTAPTATKDTSVTPAKKRGRPKKHQSNA